jgi:hypothetical protein
MKRAAFAFVVLALMAGIACLTVELTARVDELQANAITAAELEQGAAARLSVLENELERFRLAGLDKKLIGEKVVTLPQDQGAWHLSLWYRDKQSDRASAALAGFFANDEILRQVAQQSIVHEHDASRPDPVFTSRYSAEALPGVMLQNSRGQVLYKATGAGIPTTGAQLAAEILEELGVQAQDCPDGNCPLPPNDRAHVRPIFPDRRPNRRDPSKPTDGQTFAIAAAVLALGGLAAYLLSQQQRPA